jgi:hypothetical protein
MHSVSYEIFQTLVKSDKWNFDKIQIYDNDDKTIKLTIQNKTNKSDFSNVEIKFIDVNQILNGNLPSNTRKLLIEKTYPDDKISILNNLPNNFKKLKLVYINAKLNNLPCGFEVLELEGRISYLLDYLPESLKTLVIYWYNSKLDDLPSGLENLFLMDEYYGNLCNLPLGLKFIHLYAPSHIQNIILPPNIEYVNFTVDVDNNKLKKFFKLYPKVSYNDENYVSNIEMYCDN